MTEKKRYIDGEEECVEDQFLIDTETDEYFFIDHGLDKIIKRLNEQDEQIQLLLSELKHINKQKHNLVNFLKKDCHSVEEIRKIANDGDVE